MKRLRATEVRRLFHCLSASWGQLSLSRGPFHPPCFLQMASNVRVCESPWRIWPLQGSHSPEKYLLKMPSPEAWPHGRQGPRALGLVEHFSWEGASADTPGQKGGNTAFWNGRHIAVGAHHQLKINLTRSCWSPANSVHVGSQSREPRRRIALSGGLCF